MITNIPCISWEFEYILRIVSLWPHSYNISAGIALWLTWITIVPFQFMYLSRVENSVVDSMTAACDIATEVSLFLKLLLAWINREMLMGLILEMADDWQESEVKVTFETRVSCFIARLDLYLYCGVIIMYFPRVFIGYFTENPENRVFILKTTHPFEDYKSPAYEIIVILHLVQGLLMTAADLVPQALIVALICHSGTRSNILQQQLKEFIQAATKSCAADTRTLLQVEELIIEHRKIINFAERIEKVFSAISLVHCICNCVAIGCSGLVFVLSRNIFDIIRFSIYLMMKLVQTFVLCYAGEYLTNKSIAIGNVIYASEWCDLNTKIIKILQMMIIRSQKTLELTTGGFAVLSSEMFTNILKTSGSYMSVLRATY